MSDLAGVEPKGILRTSWSTRIDEYAIAAAWIAQGRVLVVADSAGGLHAFDGVSGAHRWSQASVHQDGLLAMTAHPDQATIATAGQDGKVHIWNAKQGKRQQSIEVGKGWIEKLAWSPNGRWLAATRSRHVHVFGPDAQPVWQSKAHPSTVSGLAWSRQNELATTCYGQVNFFAGPTGATLQTLEWKGSMISIVLSPDGDVVACGSQDNSVHFWRRSSAQDSMMSGYPRKPSALAFDDSGTLLATGGGKAVTVWSFDQGGPEGTRPGLLELHVDGLTVLNFAPGTKSLASGSRDGGVVLWELQSDGQGEPAGAALMEDTITALEWKADARLLAAIDANGGVCVWHHEP